jgi:PleD family two-component response regulator
VESATFDYDEEPLQITISLGATALEPSDMLETLVTRADANQYKAKQEGRNRVVTGPTIDDSAKPVRLRNT